MPRFFKRKKRMEESQIEEKEEKVESQTEDQEEEKNEEVVKQVHEKCNGTGLLDPNTLCSECEGSGKI